MSFITINQRSGIYGDEIPQCSLVISDTLTPFQFYFSFLVLLVFSLLCILYCVSHTVDDFNEDQRDVSKVDDSRNRPHDNKIDTFQN